MIFTIAIAGAGLLAYRQIAKLQLSEHNAKMIQTLHPKLRMITTRFVNRANRQGLNVKIVSAYRDFQLQQKIYNQGRTTSGSIVSNAKPGYSYHNWGAAIDITSTDIKKAAALAKSMGFEWGGDWKSFRDTPHLQYTFGYEASELLAKYNAGEVRNDGYVRI